MGWKTLPVSRLVAFYSKKIIKRYFCYIFKEFGDRIQVINKLLTARGLTMKDTIVCRCEEVTLQELEETARKYNSSARELKLLTRAGMGFCGGRTCRQAVDRVLTDITGEDPTNELPLKVAPPVRPLSLTDLGGLAKDE